MRFDTWAEFLEHQRRQPYMRQISEIVTAERRLADLPQPRRRPPAGVYPALEDVFRFTETPLRDVKVVILGQDPYHGPGYPDCRPEFLEAFQRLANLATKVGVEGPQRFRIHAPLLHMTKAEIIRTGLALGCDYSLTRSCYDPAPDGAACGRCDACQIRRAAFHTLGMKDPAP